jgi:hypothetical protein
MGGFMIAEVARLLHENGVKLPFGLYITNSVQEEIGLRGAEMITETIQPNVAIVTDVTHDTTTPMIDPKKTRTSRDWQRSCSSLCPGSTAKIERSDHPNSRGKENTFPKSSSFQSIQELTRMPLPIAMEVWPLLSSHYHFVTCIPRLKWYIVTTLKM